MSYGGRQQARRNNGYYPEEDGEALDYSDRTPAGTEYTGAYTRYTGAYTERGGTLDVSDRTPYSQGGYTRGDYTLNNSDRTPNTQYTGAYTQGGHTSNDSGRTPYSQGGYTQGGQTLNNSDRTPYSQGGYTQGGHTLNNSDRTPYGEGDGALNNSGRSGRDSYRTGTYSGTSEGINSNPYTSSYASGSGTSQLSSSRHLNSAQYDCSTQHDNPSSCASISGTTVADGGQGRCPYQIGFQVQNQGKQISSSKRIIHFRFGFANATSMSHGKTGTDCRGEEHDIVVTWSITGGKRSISMDGREIQYSVGKRANESRRADVLEASWRMSDHVYDLKCYAYKPATGSPEKRNPRWKQYTLVIDGRSFFEFPEIFELGLKGLRTSFVPVPPSSIHSNATSSVSGLSASMRSNQTNQSSEAKNSIQSRITEQRNLLNARKKALAAESRKARSQNEKAHTVSENTHDTGVESAGLESGVFSAAPSELDEVRNRMQAPRPTTSAPASMAATQNQLGQYTGYQGNQSSDPQQRQIQPQYNAHMGQKQFLNGHADRPPQTQSNGRQHHEIAFAPQQPPTYEEISRDILGAYNSSEPLHAPDTGAACMSLDISERTGFSHLVVRSDAGSVVSRDSTYVSKASFVPEKLNRGTKPAQKPSQVQQPPPPAANVPDGVNKWGYY